MKKIVLLTIAFSTAAYMFAQNEDTRRARQRVGNAGEEIVLKGNLEWARGRVAVKADDKTYFVPGIGQLVGFVDGLKEGAQVTLTGRTRDMPNSAEYGLVLAEKLTFNNKDYALAGGFAKNLAGWRGHADNRSGQGFGRGRGDNWSGHSNDWSGQSFGRGHDNNWRERSGSWGRQGRTRGW
ncbi:MAG: hypothetical protein LBH18_00885 [Spirochaetaceae bacterium]|jgi:hypothetical protein|nr:hypothetical protein [Spirochaetaceae bacterium]